VLWGAVRQMLAWKLSPQDVAAMLKRTDPEDLSLHVSHGTMDNAIDAHPKGELRRERIACLRQGHAKRLPGSLGIDRRGQIRERMSILVRPPEVKDRLMPGHCEGDLIEGAGNKSAVAGLVERMSRTVLLAKIPDASAASALVAARRSCDLGRPVAQKHGLCPGTRDGPSCRTLRSIRRVRLLLHPHRPWQRQTCENTNGQLRQETFRPRQLLDKARSVNALLTPWRSRVQSGRRRQSPAHRGYQPD
jgi:IS30 family transposase